VIFEQILPLPQAEYLSMTLIMLQDHGAVVTHAENNTSSHFLNFLCIA
jgi:hypothetical protein